VTRSTSLREGKGKPRKAKVGWEKVVKRNQEKVAIIASGVAPFGEQTQRSVLLKKEGWEGGKSMKSLG